MDFALSHESRLLVDTVRRFVDEELRPLEDLVERQDGVPPEVAAALGRQGRELGLWAMHMPTELGGGGLSMLDFCLVNEQIGRTKDVLARRAFGMVPGMLAACRLPEQLRYAHAAIQGELHVSVAMSEPGAGSDAAGIQTRAVRDGAGWRLTGSKHFISDADVAGAYVVTARCEEGISCFLLDRHTPGLSLGRHQAMMGQRGTHQHEVFFQDCPLHGWQLLGEPGRGLALAMRFINVARLAYVGARCVGLAGLLLELASEHAQQRRQFGAPIGEFQLIQGMLADMQTELYAARMMMLNAAWEIDQGRDARAKVSMVKLFASEMLGRVADHAVQIFGGMGYCTELPIERIYRDARGFRLYDGASEIHRTMIARALLSQGARLD